MKCAIKTMKTIKTYDSVKIASASKSIDYTLKERERAVNSLVMTPRQQGCDRPDSQREQIRVMCHQQQSN